MGTSSNGSKRVILGTRGSRLAIAQSEGIAASMRARFPDIEIEIRIVRTEGDRARDAPVSEIGDKGIFVRAIEAALLDGDIDIAVHSLKDVPSEDETAALSLMAFSSREDPRDVIVSRDGRSLYELGAETRVGTGSLRRRVQLHESRPGLAVANIRGNVDTRLQKLDDGLYGAVVLAAAGLHRLGLGHRISEYLPIERFTPDAGQGIVVVQGRASDSRIGRFCATIDNAESRTAAIAERAVVRALQADCRSPVGAHATVRSHRLKIVGMAAADGDSPVFRSAVEGHSSEAEQMGTKLGRELFRKISPLH